MSDASSVCSSHSATSVSLSKMSCPYCTKDLQVRAMFAHIRKFHNTELLKSTSKRWLEEAEAGKALKLFWETKNDFDETEYTIIYTCLSTNKTFTTEVKAMQHFAKDKAALKDHNKQLKQLQKDYVSMRKQEAKQQKEREKLSKKTDPSKLRLQQAIATQDPELIKALWTGIFHHVKIIKYCQHLATKQGFQDDTLMSLYIPRSFDKYHEVPFKDFLRDQNELLDYVQDLYQTRCKEYQTLKQLWIKLWTYWSVYYKDSYMNLYEDLRDMYPNFNYTGNEKYFGYATEEMEAIDIF